jgi:hypothetical protein
MKNLIGLTILALVLAALPVTVTAEKGGVSFACGTTYSVGPEDGSLLLQYHGKFSLINVGSATSIQDGKGRVITLGDIRPGDWIEYWSEPKAGSPVTRKIAVNAHANAECAAPAVLGKNG